MAHHQRAVTIAVALNTGIFIVEAVAGYQASSLTLVMDSVHNLSDEMALIALWLAFIVARGRSKTLLRGANVFNSMSGATTLIGVLPTYASDRDRRAHSVDPGADPAGFVRGWRVRRRSVGDDRVRATRPTGPVRAWQSFTVALGLLAGAGRPILATRLSAERCRTGAGGCRSCSPCRWAWWRCGCGELEETPSFQRVEAAEHAVDQASTVAVVKPTAWEVTKAILGIGRLMGWSAAGLYLPRGHPLLPAGDPARDLPAGPGRHRAGQRRVRLPRSSRPAR